MVRRAARTPRGVRRGLELDDDLGRALLQSLARPQGEGHACPAHVVDVQSERGVGLHRRVRCDFRLIAIGRNALACDDARPVLPPHGFLCDLGGIDLPDGAQHFHFLIANGAGIPFGGWLQRDQRAELKQVVLHHVAHRSGGLVEAATAFYTERF